MAKNKRPFIAVGHYNTKADAKNAALLMTLGGNHGEWEPVQNKSKTAWGIRRKS